MPELPEVETTRRGIAPHVEGHRILRVTVREARLRWPVPPEVQLATGQTLCRVERRGKYLLLRLERGTLLVHLGMSGSLRLVNSGVAPGRHEHLDIVFATDQSADKPSNREEIALRLTDPRRFGCLLWCAGDTHPLLAKLGPEPLSADFSGAGLFDRARGKRVAVKHFLMDTHVVVGVGNIYASEALFMAGIRPTRTAGRISRARYETLATAVREVLERAIRAGGTTLRDFVGGDGKPGYFAQELMVYGRGGEPCVRCATPIVCRHLGHRSAFWCPRCQR
ncbi:MAG: bifunctional DNA-formamidopyrimidine glycosylase/DNA-(apurinic or apyrimidinic site) lyase [Nitrospirota bacterium]|nr:bifunctional DNA-formamidopyrimidine glycosylase/DNA-(apurinic or apyrimidinic site) lyase [Nitrospirota bacterium]